MFYRTLSIQEKKEEDIFEENVRKIDNVMKYILRHEKSREKTRSTDIKVSEAPGHSGRKRLKTTNPTIQVKQKVFSTKASSPDKLKATRSMDYDQRTFASTADDYYYDEELHEEFEKYLTHYGSNADAQDTDPVEVSGIGEAKGQESGYGLGTPFGTDYYYYFYDEDGSREGIESQFKDDFPEYDDYQARPGRTGDDTDMMAESSTLGPISWHETTTEKPLTFSSTLIPKTDRKNAKSGIELIFESAAVPPPLSVPPPISNYYSKPIVRKKKRLPFAIRKLLKRIRRKLLAEKLRQLDNEDLASNPLEEQREQIEQERREVKRTMSIIGKIVSSTSASPPVTSFADLALLRNETATKNSSMSKGSLGVNLKGESGVAKAKMQKVKEKLVEMTTMQPPNLDFTPNRDHDDQKNNTKNNFIILRGKAFEEYLEFQRQKILDSSSSLATAATTPRAVARTPTVPATTATSSASTTSENSLCLTPRCNVGPDHSPGFGNDDYLDLGGVLDDYDGVLLPEIVGEDYVVHDVPNRHSSPSYGATHAPEHEEVKDANYQVNAAYSNSPRHPEVGNYLRDGKKLKINDGANELPQYGVPDLPTPSFAPTVTAPLPTQGVPHSAAHGVAEFPSNPVDATIFQETTEKETAVYNINNFFGYNFFENNSSNILDFKFKENPKKLESENVDQGFGLKTPFVPVSAGTANNGHEPEAVTSLPHSFSEIWVTPLLPSGTKVDTSTNEKKPVPHLPVTTIARPFIPSQPLRGYIDNGRTKTLLNESYEIRLPSAQTATGNSAVPAPNYVYQPTPKSSGNKNRPVVSYLNFDDEKKPLPFVQKNIVVRSLPPLRPFKVMTTPKPSLRFVTPFETAIPSPTTPRPEVVSTTRSFSSIFSPMPPPTTTTTPPSTTKQTISSLIPVVSSSNPTASTFFIPASSTTIGPASNQHSPLPEYMPGYFEMAKTTPNPEIATTEPFSPFFIPYSPTSTTVRQAGLSLVSSTKTPYVLLNALFSETTSTTTTITTTSSTATSSAVKINNHDDFVRPLDRNVPLKKILIVSEKDRLSEKKLIEENEEEDLTLTETMSKAVATFFDKLASTVATSIAAKVNSTDSSNNDDDDDVKENRRQGSFSASFFSLNDIKEWIMEDKKKKEKETSRKSDVHNFYDRSSLVTEAVAAPPEEKQPNTVIRKTVFPFTRQTKRSNMTAFPLKNENSLRPPSIQPVALKGPNRGSTEKEQNPRFKANQLRPVTPRDLQLHHVHKMMEIMKFVPHRPPTQQQTEVKIKTFDAEVKQRRPVLSHQVTSGQKHHPISNYTVKMPPAEKKKSREYFSSPSHSHLGTLIMCLEGRTA